MRGKKCPYYVTRLQLETYEMIKSKPAFKTFSDVPFLDTSLTKRYGRFNEISLNLSQNDLKEHFLKAQKPALCKWQLLNKCVK